MTPIGRIFIVLNLALAGGFVFVAGTSLQKHTEVVGDLDELQTRYDTETQTLQSQIASLQSDFTAKDRQLGLSEQTAKNQSVQLEELRAENERLSALANANQGTLESLRADYATVAQAIQTATDEATKARQAAIAAAQERDQAVREKDVSTGDLRDAQDRIAALEATIGEAQTQIAGLESTIREQQVLIEHATTRLGDNWVAAATPRLDGTVRHVDPNGRLVTVAVTNNPADAEIRPGYSFAIYNGTAYKGEARITEVDGNFAFCRVTTSAGAEIAVGDRATTQTN